MITFHQASPTVFVYGTSPTYWQVQAGAEDERSETEQSRHGGSSTSSSSTSSKAFRNFAVTDDASCLCFTMKVSSSVRDLSVELVEDRLHISCSYKGHRTVVDRELKDRRLALDKITATKSSSGVLTVRIPKIRKKRIKTDSAAPSTQLRIPVADAYADENMYNTNRESWSDPSVKRLELEIPFSIESRAMQVIFDEKQDRLLISGRKPGQTEPSFTSKFNISSQRIQVHKLQARLFRTSSDSSLLVITAPTRNTTNDVSNARLRRPIPIQNSDPEEELWLQHATSGSTSSRAHKIRHQITPAALALTNSTAASLASSSVQQLHLEYNILKNQILDTNVAAVEAAVDYYAADPHRMIPETLRRLV